MELLKKHSCRAGLFLLLLLCNSEWSTAAVPARGQFAVFPGASGFGTETSAGRGGRILTVTNLNNSGAGSLRAAVETRGARIIVFAVGGHIRLAKDLTFNEPFVTLAGQTAPFPGIQVSGGRITIQTHDVLIQHIRSRYGDYSGKNNSHALRVISGAYNVVVDHCTLMWADDEVASIWTKKLPIHDITFSNNIIAEGLGPHGYGTAIGSKYDPSLGPNWVNRVSIIKNLYAHNDERDPLVSRDSRVEIANNLSYNARGGFCLLGANNGPVDASVVGNHYITGAASKGYKYTIEVQRGAVGSKIFLHDNRVSGSHNRTLFRDLTGNTIISKMPLSSGYKFLPVSQVRDHVLRAVGAWPGHRDSIERRLIAEVRNETGRHKDSIADAGGWPDDYARTTSRSFARFIPADPHGDADGDGYTNIEEVLHQLAEEVENNALTRLKN
ncbi:MAG: hypothetical protein CVU69_03070 [Deltaproteobacteria bacterium HGW-Deltaproteobacteria-4]|nr:MAG: hypothetical protein CVU69_03070 [Deltaproteobacteria bacterium HGW-Deltaproteobacteria-4]